MVRSIQAVLQSQGIRGELCLRGDESFRFILWANVSQRLPSDPTTERDLKNSNLFTEETRCRLRTDNCSTAPDLAYFSLSTDFLGSEAEMEGGGRRRGGRREGGRGGGGTNDGGLQ